MGVARQLLSAPDACDLSRRCTSHGQCMTLVPSPLRMVLAVVDLAVVLLNRPAHVRAPGEYEFTPPTSQETTTFAAFADELAARTAPSSDPATSHIYLQQMLTDAVAAPMVEDFRAFDWAWLKQVQRSACWGPLTTNLLLVGMPGVVTPCHYDEQQNIFVQVRRCGHERGVFATHAVQCSSAGASRSCSLLQTSSRVCTRTAWITRAIANPW